jgi:hypothetical protein
MSLNYVEGKSLASNLLSDLNTAILASTDWTRPNSGARPATYKATTTRGVDMVIDLADAAIGNQRLQVAYYTSYDGTTLGTKTSPTRYLNFKDQNNGSAATNYVYWWLSLSKEHFFLMVEGPRPSDANADNASYGSMREYMFLADLVPYFSSPQDTTVAVVGYATREVNAGRTTTGWSHKAIASNSASGATKWGMGSLLTMDTPNSVQLFNFTPNRLGLDGNLQLAPYVYCDDTDGWRGRLNNIYYAGWTLPVGDYNPGVVSPPAAGEYTTIGGVKYKLLAANKTSNNGSGYLFGPLGIAYNYNGVPTIYVAPLIAVPCL